jgi:hypothetical protein
MRQLKNPKFLVVQLVEIKVIQPFNFVIPTRKSGNCYCTQHKSIKGGILIEFATNLGCGSGRVLVETNLNESSRLLATTIKVVGTPYMALPIQ